MNDRARQVLFPKAPKAVDLDVVVLVGIEDGDGPVLVGKAIAHASRNACREWIAQAREDQRNLLAGARFVRCSRGIGAVAAGSIEQAQSLFSYKCPAPTVGEQNPFTGERLDRVPNGQRRYSKLSRQFPNARQASAGLQLIAANFP